MDSKAKKIVLPCLVGMVVIIGILHYVTPGYMIFYHDTYRRLSYFPITIAAIIFGLPGGIALALLSCIGFIPHLLKFWAQGPQAYYSELSEIIFYMAAGIVMGFISSREHSLQKKLAHSYKRLHSQAEKLVKAEEQLGNSRKLSMLGHVSASLAHEIKNPLASIKGAAEILSDEVPEGHAKYEFIEIMKSEISRLNNSVEEVLQYCRGQQAEDKIKPESVSNIVTRVTALVDNKIKGKNITIINKTRSEFVTNGNIMTQVLLNIILNSIDAVDRQGKITIDISPENSKCRIDISDNGPGMDEQIRKDLFKPFVTSKDGGTGLGLSITKKLLKSLGGSITLTKSDAKGTIFTILIPEVKTAPNQER